MYKQGIQIMFSLLKSIITNIKELFFKGLFFILPMSLTFALFSFFFNVIKSWLIPIKNLPLWPFSLIPHYEIILVVFFIILIGLSLQFLFLRPLLYAFEQLLFQIPFISTMYGGVKKLVGAFTSQDHLSFQAVVFIEYPRKGVYSVGFVTGKIAEELCKPEDETHYNVYIPHTPNPATGNFVIAKESEFRKVDLTRQEAMTLVISGGIIQPERKHTPKNQECDTIR